MSRSVVTPWRTGLGDRPAVPLPPQPMPLLLGARPLKRWRWVGVFGEDLMLCAAAARVGPVPVWWWAVWDRRSRTLAEHTVRRAGPVRLAHGAIAIDDGPVSARLEIAEAGGIETVSPHGGGYAWTRKQGGVVISGTVTIADRRHDLDAPGIVDDSAGYHARHTSWRWSAGVGVSTAGAAVAWNLVDGLHDAPGASERTVWLDGAPHEVAPVAFASDLAAVMFSEGGSLRFSAEAQRRHRDNFLIVSSDYVQPFGTFSGSLPHAGALAAGRGVMERHDARW